jgi:hypothetical protein
MYRKWEAMRQKIAENDEKENKAKALANASKEEIKKKRDDLNKLYKTIE